MLWTVDCTPSVICLHLAGFCGVSRPEEPNNQKNFLSNLVEKHIDKRELSGETQSVAGDNAVIHACKQDQVMCTIL